MACSSVCASQLWSLPLSFISRSLPSAEGSAPPLSASIQAVSDTTSPGQKDGFVWQIRLRSPRVYSGLSPHLCEHFVPALHHHWLDISCFLGCLSTDVAFIKSFQLGGGGSLQFVQGMVSFFWSILPFSAVSVHLQQRRSWCTTICCRRFCPSRQFLPAGACHRDARFRVFCAAGHWVFAISSLKKIMK